MSYQSYVKIKGTAQGQFKGESKRSGRSEMWFEVLKHRMGSTVPSNEKSGELKGHRIHNPLVITKERGASSPQILQAHWSNEVLTEVVFDIVGRDSGGKKEVVKERITLTDAVIVSVDRYTDERAGKPGEHDVDHLEDIGFRFRKIMVEDLEASTSTSDDWVEPEQK